MQANYCGVTDLHIFAQSFSKWQNNEASLVSNNEVEILYRYIEVCDGILCKCYSGELKNKLPVFSWLGMQCFKAFNKNRGFLYKTFAQYDTKDEEQAGKENVLNTLRNLWDL